MAKRTPRNQLRSQYHSYWGEFAYSSTPPDPATFQGMVLPIGGMALPNAPDWSGVDTKELERGDTAFVYDALGVTGSFYAPWVCLDAGTYGGLDAVWGPIGAPVVTSVELDFTPGGTTPCYSKEFAVVDARVAPSSRILVFQSGDTATGRVGNDLAWDQLLLGAVAGTGQFTISALATPGPISGRRVVLYQIL